MTWVAYRQGRRGRWCVTEGWDEEPEATPRLLAQNLTEAEARLVAAAPDLLDALALAQLVVIAWDASRDTTGGSATTIEGRDVRAAVDAALARAERRES